MLISRNEMYEYYFYGINHFIVKCIDIRHYLSVDLLSRDYQFDTLFTIYFWCFLGSVYCILTENSSDWVRGGKNENICFKWNLFTSSTKIYFPQYFDSCSDCPVCNSAKNSVGNKWILNLINMKSKLIHTHLKMSQQNETIIHYLSNNMWNFV